MKQNIGLWQKQDAHVREQSRICGIRNAFTSLIEFQLKHTRITSFRNFHMRIISICHYDFFMMPKNFSMNGLKNLVGF